MPQNVCIIYEQNLRGKNAEIHIVIEYIFYAGTHVYRFKITFVVGI